jgi:hypothetical protein
LLLAAVAGASVLVGQAVDDGGSGSATHAVANDAPDIVVAGLPGVDLRPLTELPGLAAASGPYSDVQSSVRHHGREEPIRLEARSMPSAAVGGPHVISGTWPRRPEDGIVVESQLASRLRIRAGDRVRVTGVDGRIPLRVSAVAAESGPGVAYLHPRLLSKLAPSSSTHGSALSLRLDDPGRAQEYRRWIERRFPAGQVTVNTPRSGG